MLKLGIGLLLLLGLLLPVFAAEASDNSSRTRIWIEQPKTPVAIPDLSLYLPPAEIFTPDGYIIAPRSPVEIKNERERIIEYIQELWGNQSKVALNVMICESNLNPSAINWDDALITGYASWGIAQLNRPKFEGWDDWKINLDEAFKLYLQRKFVPWTCYKNA